MTQQIQQMGARSEGFYRAFIDSTVLPHAALVAQLVTIGEWVAGLSLALGLLTRVGALTGMLLVLNYMLLKGLPNVAGSIDRLFFVSCLGFLLSSAGLVWGLDGALSAALARLPVVNWCAGLSGARGRATAYSRS
jgi:uncharacterized membrane protein YphA (DoxX/SURF4 family)